MRHSNLYSFILLITFGLLSQNVIAQSCADTDVTPPTISCPSDVIGLTCADALPLAAVTVDEFNLIEPGTAIADDDCGIETITVVDNPDPSTFSFCADEGPFIVTRTYTVIDSVGQQASCSYTFTFDADTEGPVFSDLDNIPGSALLECSESITPEDLETNYGDGYPTINDDCSGTVSAADFPVGFDPDMVVMLNGITISYSDNIISHPNGVCSGTMQRKYRIERTWTASDACGNESSITQLINVVDNSVEPVANATSDDLIYEVLADCSTIVNASEVEEGSTDNCGAGSLDPSTYDLSGSALIRIAGTMDDFVSALTIDDSVIDFEVASPFPITLELQVTDECGNVGVTTKDILITDTTAPVISCPSIVLGLQCMEDLPEGASTAEEFSALDEGASVSDNCGIDTILYSDSPDPATFSFCADDGPFIVTRTYTVVDFAGLQTMCTQSFVFDPDTEGAEFTDVENIMADQQLACEDSKNPADLEARFGEGFPTIVDNCSGGLTPGDFLASPAAAAGFFEDTPFMVNGFTVSYSDTEIVHPLGVCTGDFQRKYRILRTWTVVDPCGNESSTVQNINVVDNFVAPIAVATSDDLAYFVIADCTAEVNASDIEEGSTDNCGTGSDDPSTYDLAASALIRIAGTTDMFSSILLIDDNIVDFSVVSPFPVTIELQVTDECGNTGVTTKEIFVADSIAPSIACPQAISGLTCIDDLPEGANSVMEFLSLDQSASVSDNCGIDTIFFNDDVDPSSFSFCEIDGPFVVTRTYTVVDFAGLQDTCSQIFTFDPDTASPEFSSLPNIMSNDLLECGDAVDPATLENRFGDGYPTITDVCTGVVTPDDFSNSSDDLVEDQDIVLNGITISYSDTTISHPLGVCTGEFQRKYRIIRTWTAADACGNVSSTTQNINVIDNFTPPTANVIADELSFYIDSACSILVNAADIEDGSTDNCSGTSEDPSSYDVAASAVVRVAGSLDTFSTSIVVDSTVIDFDVANPFPIMVEMQISDECGNTSVALKEILVRDSISPTISCPADMVFNLLPLQCDSVLTLMLPTVSDNCAGVVLNRLDNNGYELTDAFPSGVYEFSFQAEDASGNTSDICTFTAEVVESPTTSLSCIGSINVSIDENCSGNITPRMLLLGNDYGCLDSFNVVVLNEDGVEVPNMFTGEDVGKSFTYQVYKDQLFCEGIVNVEDKFPPQIACSSDTITCGELIVFPEPVITENCSGATLTLLNETFENVDCNDPELQQIITRTWQATDAAGNLSNICEQVLSISKFDIGTVQPPANSNIDLQCGATFPQDGNGNPDPLVYGSPRLSGVNLWPQQFLVCNLMVDYEDMTLQTSQNTISVVRTWTATTWYCGVDSTVSFVQVFDIADTEGPVMACPADMTLSTSGFDCSAETVLPAIPVSDICGDVVQVNVQYEGGFIEDSNGGLAYLPNGTSSVTYTAFDSNGNFSSCSFNVTVLDLEQPTPICEQFTVVSLTNDGTAIADASMFDDGSYDACGPVTIEVRRMNATCDPVDIVFGESVTFCCEDLDEEQMVVLRITDEAGNYNECMVTAEVQDKIPPVLVQGLPDITLSCEFPFNVDDTEQFGSIVMDVDDREDILLTAELVEFGGEAIDGLVLGNCIELISDEFTFSNIGSCGTGSATRILTFANQQGLTVSDVQNITFINPSPFTIDDITFPGDISFTNLCDFEATHPDNLPEGFSYPVFTEDGCDQVGLDYDDQVIDDSDGALSCYQIIRTWTLADWCQNSGGTFTTFEGTQVITVTNTVGPEITGDCSNREQCSFDVECGPMFIELVNEGTDDCTANEFLDWTYAIDAFSDGSIDITGSTADASGTYPVGLHTIYWALSDGCGNEDLCSYTFEIKNCKTPTPICLDNLTTEIIATDIDGDTNADTEQVTITASFFDGGSYHVCGTPVQLSFSSDVLDTVRVYGCDDVGEQAIQLWATDVNGNQDFCTTTLDVQNNIDEGLCPITVTFDITGEMKTEDDEMISHAIVVLEGSEMTDETTETGTYDFADMPFGNTYTVNPGKDIDPMNGVTTLDIILIQKHILGLQLLESPLDLIAADVNHSDNVSGSDIIQLRKMILGVYENFPDNTSWRFIDNDHVFIDPTNPWISDLPETYAIDELTENMVVDFRGVKIGDVNGSAIPNDLIGDVIDSRSDDVVQLTVDSGKLVAGESIWIPVYANNFENLLGAQVNLNFDPLTSRVLEVRGGALTIANDYYAIDNTSGNLAIIWHEGQPKTIDSKDVLFEILVSSKVDQEFDDLFTIADDRMMSEAYDAALQTRKLDIVSRANENTMVYVDFELSQNEPNPWRTETTIEITSTLKGSATLLVSNMNGQKVFEKDIEVQSGVNRVLLTKEDLPASGVFYYEVKMGDNKVMKKMVIIN